MAVRRREPRKAGRPPAGDGDATRRRIMDAAQLCFAAHGFRETSNRTIADAADITPGTIYHYFENKQELFLAVHEEIQAAIIEAIEAAIAKERTFAESVDHMLRAQLELFVEHPEWSRFNAAVRAEARRNSELSGASRDDAWRRIFRILVDRGVAAGEIKASDKRAIQAVLSAMVLGLNQHAVEARVVDHLECVRGFASLLKGEAIALPREGAAQ